jgi:hypothetical protein
VQGKFILRFLLFFPGHLLLFPLGVLVALILVSPSGMVLLGVISSWSRVIIVSFFSLSSWNYSVDGPGFSIFNCSKYEVVEWERDEQN